MIKIHLYRADWTDTVGDAIENANYFSGVEPVWTPYFDGHTHLIESSLDEIEYTREQYTADTDELFLASGNVRFELSTIERMTNGQSLVDFFSVYDSRPLVKWMVEILDGNFLKFRGMIYKNAVSMSDRQRDVITVTAISMEREFKDFYSNKPLPNLQWNVDIPEPYDDLVDTLPGFQLIKLGDAIRFMFDSFNLSVDIDDGIDSYYMIYLPYLYGHDLEKFRFGQMHMKTGYYNFQADKVSCFNWLNSLCLSKGWMWFFYQSQLTIKPRQSVSYANIDLDYNTTVMNHDVSSSYNDGGSIDTVIIDDGQFRDKDDTLLTYYQIAQKPVHVDGQRCRVYSVRKQYNNRCVPYFNLELVPSVNPQYRVNLFNCNTVKFVNESTNNIERFGRYEFEDITIGTIIVPTTTKRVEYFKPRIVRLSPIINSDDNMCGLDVTNARNTGGAVYGNGNYIYSGHDAGTNGFWHTGNPGNSVFKYNSGVGLFDTYDDYCSGTEFANNMKPLLRNGVDVQFEITTDGVQSYPLVNYRLLNYPYANDGLPIPLTLDKLKYNLITKKTTLSARWQQ